MLLRIAVAVVNEIYTLFLSVDARSVMDIALSESGRSIKLSAVWRTEIGVCLVRVPDDDVLGDVLCNIILYDKARPLRGEV